MGAIDSHTTTQAVRSAVRSAYAYQGKKNQSLTEAFRNENAKGKTTATALARRAERRRRGSRRQRTTTPTSAATMSTRLRVP
jgi:hypothetical protein